MEFDTVLIFKAPMHYSKGGWSDDKVWHTPLVFLTKMCSMIRSSERILREREKERKRESMEASRASRHMNKYLNTKVKALV